MGRTWDGRTKAQAILGPFLFDYFVKATLLERKIQLETV
jgi:hypothetical protein